MGFEKQVLGKGQIGSALMGSLHCIFVVFVDRETFWVLPLTYFDHPKSARAHPFPQSVKIKYFCGGPLVLTPVVRNQGTLDSRTARGTALTPPALPCPPLRSVSHVHPSKPWFRSFSVSCSFRRSVILLICRPSNVTSKQTSVRLEPR